MLVLDRNLNGVVVITVNGVEFRLVVLSIHRFGHRIKLGFDAPPEVIIDREEVHEAKMESANGTR